MLERERFSRQTALTDPGARRPLLAPLPSDVSALREVPLRVSMHFRRLEAAGVDVTPRRAEARIRAVRRMLDRIAALDPRPLDRERERGARLVGHCRTSAVLLTAFLRDKGIAARPRSGFSAYWRQPMRTGHWVTEYWSELRGEWLLADADLDDEWVRLGDLQFALCDVPHDRFLVAGEAWLALRGGDAPERSFGEDPDVFGLEYVRAQLLRDVACLVGVEVGPFDRFGLAAVPFDSLREDELSLLDELARLSIRPHEDGRLADLVASAPAAAPPPEIALDDAAAARFMLDTPDLWRRE